MASRTRMSVSELLKNDFGDVIELVSSDCMPQCILHAMCDKIPESPEEQVHEEQNTPVPSN